VADRFAPGARVRTRRTDPAHHTRLPRYARGAVGTVVEAEGRHPLADDRARGLPSEPRTVYAVRFCAEDLFGTGDHAVVLSLWEDYLSPLVADEADRER
jgi:nitrile hydratase subunit beta